MCIFLLDFASSYTAISSQCGCRLLLLQMEWQPQVGLVLGSDAVVLVLLCHKDACQHHGSLPRYYCAGKVPFHTWKSQ